MIRVEQIAAILVLAFAMTGPASGADFPLADKSKKIWKLIMQFRTFNIALGLAP